MGAAVTAALLFSLPCALASELQVGEGKQFLTIGAAIAAAKTGDVVKVWPGTYEEKVGVKNGLCVKGVDRALTKIVGSVDMGSNASLVNLSINASSLDKYVISVRGLDSRIVSINVTGGGYYSLVESLIEISYSARTLVYDCVLQSENATCVLLQNNSRNTVVMRTEMNSANCYRRMAKTPVVIKDSNVVKFYNNDIRRDRSWFPGWVGEPVLSAQNSNRLRLINNIFISVVDNNFWQYGYNGLWVENCLQGTIRYNIFYQTGLFGVIPFSQQNHISGENIRFANNLNVDPYAGGDKGPFVDAGSPASPRDPDGTRADIGRAIFIQYDNLMSLNY